MARPDDRDSFEVMRDAALPLTVTIAEARAWLAEMRARPDNSPATLEWLAQFDEDAPPAPN